MLEFYNKHKKEYQNAYNAGCDFEKELIVIELLKLAKKFSTKEVKKRINNMLKE